MYGVVNLTTYILGAIAIILLPGPNSLFCLAVAARQGFKEGYKALMGIFVGDTMLILATVFGVSAVLKHYPALFHGVKIVGGLYLAYLGFNLIKGGWQTWQNRHLPPDDTALQPTQPKNAWFNFQRALILSLTNPKAILFFLSFFVAFVDPTYPNPLLSFFILAIILQFFSLIYLNVIIFAGKKLANQFAKNKLLASGSMVLVGLLFMSFAIKLWTASI